MASSASVASSPSEELLPGLVLLPSVSKLGVVVTERALSGVALLPRLASSPKRGIVVAERVPSGVALLPSVHRAVWRCCPILASSSSLLSSTTRRQQNDVSWVLDLGVGGTRKGNKYLLGGNNEWPGALSMVGKA